MHIIKIDIKLECFYQSNTNRHPKKYISKSDWLY